MVLIWVVSRKVSAGNMGNTFCVNPDVFSGVICGSFCPRLNLVDHCFIGARILDEVVREPERDLFFGVLDGIRAMADVTANCKAIVTADGARG